MALGIFVLWELFYLPVANYVRLFPARTPPHRGELNDDVHARAESDAGGWGQSVVDRLAYLTSRWGELSGQAQGWSLFAPIFPHQALFPALEVGGEIYPSSFRPVDPDAYFRPPRPSCRLANYEYHLAIVYARWTPEWYRANPDVWDRAIRERVQRQHRSMLAYMRWRLDRAARERGGALAPTSVVLHSELIPSRSAGSSSSAARPEPRRFGLARWLPQVPPPPGHLPIQGRTGPYGEWVWLREDD